MNWFMFYFRTSSSAREEKGLPDTVEELDAKYNVLPTSSQLLGFEMNFVLLQFNEGLLNFANVLPPSVNFPLCMFEFNELIYVH